MQSIPLPDTMDPGRADSDWTMEHVPTAFAVVTSRSHVIVQANAAFRRVANGAREATGGTPVAAAVCEPLASALLALLAEVESTRLAVRDRLVPACSSATPWCSTAWPAGGDAASVDHVLVELHPCTDAEWAQAFRRDLAERMLLGALRELEAADTAEAARARATFLALGAARLAESLDEETTLHTIAGLALPQLGAWCIVDMLHADGTMQRVAIVHPDPDMQAMLRAVAADWAPNADDAFGIPVALRSIRPVVVSTAPGSALAAAAHTPEATRVLQELGPGPLLIVPLVVRGEQLIGAVTFVASSADHEYDGDDMQLALDLAARSSKALDSARLHGEAVARRARAESASDAKSTFLAMMGHELRTPLNAIGGYIDLIDMGLRGPVTAEQRSDLARIRQGQRHLSTLVTDILNLVRVGSAGLLYATTDLRMGEELAAAIALVEPLITDKGLVVEKTVCGADVVARADREKVAQILINLLSNAIKFTPRGGHLHIDCVAEVHGILVHLRDEGIGIDLDKQSVIFDPFVQVNAELAGRDAGVGLGLAISRTLARGMGGDLSVESAPGQGSTFTLRLPRGAPATTS